MQHISLSWLIHAWPYVTKRCPIKLKDEEAEIVCETGSDIVFPRFRGPLFTLTNMADRESSSENNPRSRSVLDFVRTILHAVTNLQTQSGNPDRAQNNSRAEFSSPDEEINARFQIPRQSLDRRGILNRSATSTRVLPSTAYNPRQNYSPVQRNVSRYPRYEVLLRTKYRTWIH